MSFLPSRQQWRTWSVPSKASVIGAFVSVLSLALYLVSGLGSNFRARRDVSVSVPAVLLDLVNSGTDPVSIEARGDLVLWLPQGVGEVRSIPGKYELQRVGKSPAYLDFVTIRPSSNTLTAAHLSLLGNGQLASILDDGATDLEFVMRRKDGGILFSGEIPFTREALQKRRWLIEVSKKAEAK